MKKIIMTIMMLLASGLALGSASENGCEHSGGTAAGCGEYSDTVDTNDIINTIENTNTIDVNNPIDINNTVEGSSATSTSTSSATGGAGGNAEASVSEGAVQVNVNGNGNGGNRPVSTALAPSLTSGMDSCMGSSSLGAQGVGFGVSAGTTWTDKHCILLKSVKMFMSMGLPDVACYRARMGEEGKLNDEALAAAGIDCSMFAPPIVPISEVKAVTEAHQVLYDQDSELVTRQQMSEQELEEQKAAIADVDSRLDAIEAKYNAYVERAIAKRLKDQQYANDMLTELKKQ